MKKSLQVLVILKLIMLMPFAVLNGNKKRMYRKIKIQMLAANLL